MSDTAKPNLPANPNVPVKPSAPVNEVDRVFAEARSEIGKFRFDAAVARVFPDMIRRSVPGYTLILPMIGVIASRYAQPGSNCYDLGCSLGGATLAMRHGISAADCRIIGIDNSADMIERCAHYIALDDAPTPVDLQCADIRETPIINASIVTLNFTLQFVSPADRVPLLRRIHDGLRPGGVLVLSEKICFADEEEQARQETLYYDFKRANGYSELEISQKRTALERVLIPETIDTHRQRLRDAGFECVVLWYQCFNFMSLLAIRSENS